MSGFAVHVGAAQPAAPERVAALSDAVRHRGPDGVTVSQVGTVTLVHAQFVTTPEARLEVQPLRHAVHPWWLVADARIDNRDELRPLLDGSVSHPLVTDPDFILCAYERWGERAAEHLIGDFAFALWDESQQRLLVGRDHLGVRPAYWAQGTDGSLVVGSTLRAVLEGSGVDPAPDMTYLADYARWEMVDPTATPYAHVHRLPGGHTLRAGQGQHPVVERYWFLDVPYRRVDPQTAAAEVAKLFRRAVEVRLRSDTPVAVQVSGGFDSTSVAAVAAQLVPKDRLVALAQVFPGLDCDESEYIDAAGASIGICVEKFDALACGPYDFVEEVRQTRDLPSTPDSKWYVPLDRRAAELGCRVVLDGQGGDHLLLGSLAGSALGLLAQGHLRHWRRLMDRAGYSRLHAARHVGRELARSLTFSLPPIARDALMRRVRARRLSTQSRFVRAAATGSVLVDKEVGGLTGPFSRTRQHRRLNYLGEMSWFIDLWDRLSTPSGVEARHPFLDVRLIEYVVALGEDVVTDGDQFRGLHRLALAGLLPETTLARRDKASFNVPWVASALSVAGSVQRLATSTGHQVRDLVECDALTASLSALEHNPWPSDGIWHWWAAMSLCAWWDGTNP